MTEFREKMGWNIDFMVKKIQEAIRKVETWALEWSFRLSVAKQRTI